MNRMKFQNVADRHSARVQRGSALLEVALAVAVTGALVVSGMQYWAQQLRSDTARALAGQYRLLNEAVGNYMTVNWTELTSNNLGAHCDGSMWAVGWPVTLNGTCVLNIRGQDGATVPVAHALQPTIEELQALNFLPRTFNGRPLLPDDPSVEIRRRFTEITPQGGLRQLVAEPTHTLGIYIQRVCTNQADATPLSCLQPNRDLRSLVFNQRPYRTDVNGDWPLLNEAMLAMENDGLVSMPDVGGVERNVVGRQNDIELPNPIRRGNNTAGNALLPSPFGVLAMRNGFGSSGWGQFTRRDGSAPPTADWDFNQRSLTEVNNLTGMNVAARSSLSLPREVNANACDPTTQNIARQWDTFELMECTRAENNNFIWRTLRNNGAVNAKNWIDVRIDMITRNGHCQASNLSPDVWGMPTLINFYTGRTNWVNALPFSSSPHINGGVWNFCIEGHQNNNAGFAIWRLYALDR